MTDHPSYITELITKHFFDCQTEEEEQKYQHWLAADPAHQSLVDYLSDSDRLRIHWKEYRAIDARASWEAIRARLPDSGLATYEEEPLPVIHP